MGETEFIAALDEVDDKVRIFALCTRSNRETRGPYCRSSVIEVL